MKNATPDTPKHKSIERKHLIFLIYWIVLLWASMWILGAIPGIIHIGGELFFNGIFLIPIIAVSLIISRKRSEKKWEAIATSFAKQFFEKFTTFLTICSALSYLMMGAFVYQYAIHNPARLPIYKIETGDKTITLISMVHIASPEFYQNVQNKVRDHLSKSGSVVYYEWVQSGSASGNTRLKEILNTDLNEFYDEMADHAALVSQGEENTLTKSNREHNIDMTSDEIVRLYEARKEKSVRENSENIQVLFPDEDLSNLRTLLETKTEREKQLQMFLLRTLFSMSTRHQAFFGQEIVGGWDPFFDTILIDRNQYVVDTIQKRGDKDILILYGSLHIPGIIDLLKAKDPNLKQEFIESIPLF